MSVESIHDPPAARPPPQPQTLAYDDLPRGSDLRRQYGEDGSVAVTVPAGEPSEAALHTAAQATGVSAALFCAPCLLIALAAFGMGRGTPGIERGLRPLAVIVFAVFSGGVFLLVWRVLYTTRLRTLAEAWRQATLLHASPHRLIVETTGPFGDHSHDFPAHTIHSIRATHARALASVQVTTSDGTVYRLLPGRDGVELSWVAATLRQALGRPISMPSDKEGPQSR